MTEKKERAVPYWKDEKNRSAIEGLRARYPDLHPLVFHRSMERASGLGDLFDLLSKSVPSDGPFVWDAKLREWRQTPDIFQTEALIMKEGKD